MTTASDFQPDPTQNVRALIDSAIKHSDDLRNAEIHRIDQAIQSEGKRVDEKIGIWTSHLTAIRTVDVNAVAVANQQAVAQANVLATQLDKSAEVLRALVATTAAATAAQLAQQLSQFTERLASLEKFQNRSDGSGNGARDMWGYVFAIGMGLITTAVAIWAVVHTAKP